MRTAVLTGLTLATLAMLVACSSKKTTVQTSSGAATVTTSQDNKTVTVESSAGTVSVGQNVDQSKLGAPVYPGAQPNEQGSITSNTDKGASVIAALTAIISSSVATYCSVPVKRWPLMAWAV